MQGREYRQDRDRNLFQVVDSLLGRLPSSRWSLSSTLRQNQPFNYDFNSGSAHQSMLLLRQPFRGDLLYSLSFSMEDFVVFSLILAY